jgi:hypothetical protein
VTICSNCGSEVPYSVDRCTTCGEPVGAPNVRAAADPREVGTLQKRYEEAVFRAKARGAEKNVEQFEAAVANSSAVLNCGLHFLRELVSNSKTLYTNYHLAVSSEVRKAAAEQFAKDRLAVDALLFGDYGQYIRDAALSLDGKGLSSYGRFSLKFREVAIAKRASLLEENAFKFVERHDVKPGKPAPPGHRAVWNYRKGLAVAKLADFIGASTSSSEFPNILLFDSGERTDDEFIEVHIFGTFDQNAIESVTGNSESKKPAEKAMLAVLKEDLEQLGKAWVEA